MSSDSPDGLSGLKTLPRHVLTAMKRTRVRPGDVLVERYRVGASIGGGAMGEVFAAENLGIGLPVAIKVLRPELLSDDAFRARFEQEAKAIASVRHPNVVRFFDLVVGSPTFLVMERVDGGTLAALLRDAGGPLPPNRVARLMEQLCWGLHAAHRAGIIHRDLKPANVLVETDEEHGEVPKIIDFGLAKTVASSEEKLTRTGQIVGTPDYMSPEQIAGTPIDARADMYSLGCVAYEMLTGRLPFMSATPERSGKEDLQVLYQHVHQTPSPPSTHNPKVPPAVDAVVMRMLAKLPGDRYPSMKEAAAAWVRSIEKRTTSDGPPTTTGARAFALGALTTLLLSGLSVGGALYAKRLQSAERGSLLLDTTPPGATVAIDGAPHGETTPTLVPLPRGEHRVRLQHAGYADVERTVQLDASERRALQISLPPTQRTIEITTVPANGNVYLDGHLVGVAPLRLQAVADDFHEIRVERTGYEDGVRAIKPDDNQTQLTINLVPETQARGAVVVEADRVADVWIDGAFTGFRTPTIAIRVSEGPHTVELRDDLRPLHTRKVDVARGETLHLSLPTGTSAPPKP